MLLLFFNLNIFYNCAKIGDYLRILITNNKSEKGLNSTTKNFVVLFGVTYGIRRYLEKDQQVSEMMSFD